MQLKAEQLVDVHVSGSNAVISGKINRISPALNPQTRSLAFEVDLPNPDGAMRAGLFATGDVVVDGDGSVIAIPKTAVTQFAGVERVWKISGDRLEYVTVRTGEVQEGFVEILSGIEAGDQIVLPARGLKVGPVQVLSVKDLVTVSAISSVSDHDHDSAESSKK